MEDRQNNAPSHEKAAVWQNDLNSVPHRSSSVLSLRSCLAGGFSRNFCSADRINPCSSAMRRISRCFSGLLGLSPSPCGRDVRRPALYKGLCCLPFADARQKRGSNGSSSTNTSRRARKWTGKSTRSSLTTCSSAMPCTRWQPVTTVMSSPSGSFAPRATSTWASAKKPPVFRENRISGYSQNTMKMWQCEACHANPNHLGSTNCQQRMLCLPQVRRRQCLTDEAF